MFEIQSVASDAKLEFADFDGTSFKAILRSDSHFAVREVYSPTDPRGVASLFQSVAAEWRGWSGAKTWCSHEGEFGLELTSDARGHITLLARINHDCGNADPWRLECTLSVEAGQLEVIAKRATLFFSLCNDAVSLD